MSIYVVLNFKMKIGLFQVNITLMAMPVFGNESNDMDINFNERYFHWNHFQIQKMIPIYYKSTLGSAASMFIHIWQSRCFFLAAWA